MKYLIGLGCRTAILLTWLWLVFCFVIALIITPVYYILTGNSAVSDTFDLFDVTINKFEEWEKR